MCDKFTLKKKFAKRVSGFILLFCKNLSSNESRKTLHYYLSRNTYEFDAKIDFNIYNIALLIEISISFVSTGYQQ